MVQRFVVSVILIAAFIAAAVPAYAQTDDPCSPEAIIASFVAAVEGGTVDIWVTEIVAGSCPETSINGALALADTYHAMIGAVEESPVVDSAAAESSADVTITGDYAMLQVLDIVGLERLAAVQRIVIEDDISSREQLAYLHNSKTCVILQTIENMVYVAIPLWNFRAASTSDGIQTVTLADGAQLQGTFVSKIISQDGDVVQLRPATQVTLISLPEALAAKPVYEDDPALWTLTVTDPFEATYTGTNPRFLFSYYSTSGYLIGGEDHNKMTNGFQMTIGEQSISLSLADFQSIVFPNDFDLPATITTKTGVTSEGLFDLIATDDKGTHSANGSWFVLLDLDEGSQIIVIKSTAQISLSRAE